MTKLVQAVSRFIIAISLPLACTAASAESGTVTDRTTGKPISGAVVVATWEGVIRLAVQPASQCYKTEIAITDDLGRFEVSSFSWNLDPLMMDRHRSVRVLAPGYQVAPEWQVGNLHFPMEPSSGTAAEKFARLPTISPLSCTKDKKLLLPYLKVLYQEMSLLATSQAEKVQASGVLFAIETIELGEDIALRRLGEREAPLRGGGR